MALVVCGVWAASSAYAQSTLQACVQIADNVERLACYDELAKPTEQSFGLQNAAAASVPADEIQNIETTVTAATHSPYTGWVITFENGQSWKQIGTDSFAIREGDSCVIERAVMNSFRLKCGNRERRIRITREQ